jgi:hypothetical protein
MTEQANSDEIISAIQKFKTAFQNVERLLKTYELSNHEAFLPAINELRYAGFHVLSGYNELKAKWDIRQITKGISHCNRAYCDTIDAAILFTREATDFFIERYKGHSEQVYTVLPNLEVDWQEIEDVHIKVRSIRSGLTYGDNDRSEPAGHFDLEKRTISLEQLEPDLEKLLIYFDKLRKAAPRIDGIIKEKEERVKHDKKKLKWQRCIDIIVGALLGVFFGWLFKRFL